MASDGPASARRPGRRGRSRLVLRGRPPAAHGPVERLDARRRGLERSWAPRWSTAPPARSPTRATRSSSGRGACQYELEAAAPTSTPCCTTSRQRAGGLHRDGRALAGAPGPGRGRAGRHPKVTRWSSTPRRRSLVAPAAQRAAGPGGGEPAGEGPRGRRPAACSTRTASSSPPTTTPSPSSTGSRGRSWRPTSCCWNPGARRSVTSSTEARRLGGATCAPSPRSTACGWWRRWRSRASAPRSCPPPPCRTGSRAPGGGSRWRAWPRGGGCAAAPGPAVGRRPCGARRDRGRRVPGRPAGRAPPPRRRGAGGPVGCRPHVRRHDRGGRPRVAPAARPRVRAAPTAGAGAGRRAVPGRPAAPRRAVPAAARDPGRLPGPGVRREVEAVGAGCRRFPRATG